ncbi:MAG: response regulator [Oscillospiraceae bacterium]|nr:response regulator [Oscillospiraceae bacterium]
MYRVVLIDDEEIIVKGLRRVLEWESFGCRVVAEASDAGSGAAAIREHRPDIVFTDIKMPDEDGLTMLAGLKSEFPDMQVAVLTGYRDFEYARRAIELGVSRFLLKPSKMEELEEALRHMTAALDARGARSEDEPEQASGFIASQARAYIAEHCTERLSLQEVAEHCYVSQWHLSKLLNRQLGQSFYDILNSVRIEKAKRLLEDPSLRISEIGELAGYADTAHFSRVFKKYTGVSANEFRNSRCAVK